MSARSKPKKRKETKKPIKLGRHGKMRESFKELKQDIESKFVPVVKDIAVCSDKARGLAEQLIDGQLKTELLEFSETTKKDAEEFGERVGQMYQKSDELSKRLPKNTSSEVRDLSFVAGASLGVEALQLTEDLKDYHRHTVKTFEELQARATNSVKED